MLNRNMNKVLPETESVQHASCTHSLPAVCQELTLGEMIFYAFKVYDPEGTEVLEEEVVE